MSSCIGRFGFDPRTLVSIDAKRISAPRCSWITGMRTPTRICSCDCTRRLIPRPPWRTRSRGPPLFFSAVTAILGGYSQRVQPCLLSRGKAKWTLSTIAECPSLTPSGHQARPQSVRTTRAGFDHRWFLLDHSELRPQPIGNPARDLCRRFVGDREYRTDVDLAKHVAVGPVGARRAEHEVRVPDHR